MSKLEELINQLCPDGVEYKQLKDVCDIKGRIGFRGYTRNDLVDCGEGAITLSPSNIIDGQINFDKCTYLSWYKYDESPEIQVEINDIIFTKTASVGKCALITNMPEKCTINPQLVVLKKLKCSSGYLTYILQSKKFQNTVKGLMGIGSVPNISQSTLGSILIPIPPLPVQEEIVRILDNMTSLTAELTKKLAEEKAARQKQYEYYRNSLLSFDESRGIIVKLKDICEIYLGLTATPKYTESGVKFISAQNTSKDYLDLTNTKYISVDDFAKATSNAKPKRGDLLFTRVGSNIGHPVIVETDEDLCIFVSLGYLRNKDRNVVDVRYLRYWMNTEMFWEQVRKNVHGAAKINLNTGWLKEFDVFLPSLEEQQRIVDILDRFDKLCNDISEGLPAEIEARKKQYEYYRDKLLTFKEKEG